MCETPWDVDIEDGNDEFLLEKIKKITPSFMNKELPDMDDLFGSKLRFDESTLDVEARVTAYFHLDNGIIEHNGVTALFSGDDGINRKYKVLLKFLPRPLSRKVVNELEYRSKEAKPNVRSLYKVVSNLALELEKKNKALVQMKANTSKYAKPFSTRGTMKISNDKKTAIMTRNVPKTKLKKLTGYKKVTSAKSWGLRRPNRVFIVKENTALSSVRRQRKRTKKLLGQNEKQISKHDVKSVISKEDATRLCRIRDCLPLEGGTVLLEGVCSVPFCADSGATRISISERIFQRLRVERPSDEYVGLEESISWITVGGGIEVIRAVYVRVTLRTAAGPVSISSPVQCLVVPGEVEEFLLGKEVLTSLGIDVDRELEMLASQNQQDEPDEFDEPVVSFASELSDDVEKQGGERIGQAAQKGFPKEYLEGFLFASTCGGRSWVTCGFGITPTIPSTWVFSGL
ncbi:hypothetical protein PHMEG_0009148 [Phytophthora megakarya]|uniref:Uncharacterized protein n=1 Tax=Phytophthora megakarya TaxID=4795 RepID=A0A225WIY6_9STRA|nr:hypothetical protein PHMEG_0009148 [Phytophthora megakarya]